MTIPLIGFLYLYLLFVAFWLIFSLIALYHILRYGQINFTTFIAAFAYLAVAAIILNFSYQTLSQIDWSAGLTIFQGRAGAFGVDYF